jgi:hypothetical protein
MGPVEAGPADSDSVAPVAARGGGDEVTASETNGWPVPDAPLRCAVLW